MDTSNLSELIKSVGYKNFHLNEINGTWLCKGGEKMIAVIGSNPEEAVSKLLIELSKLTTKE